MFIEDLVHRMACGGPWLFLPGIKMLPQDEKILVSFSDQLTKGLGLTEKQAVLAQRMIKKYSSQLNSLLKIDVVPFADKPMFKFPLRSINKNKIIKIIIDENNKKRIATFFPYDEELIASIRKFKKELSENAHLLNRNLSYENQPAWNETNKVWTFPLWEECLEWISVNLIPLEFTVEEEVSNYIKDIQNIKNSIEQYVPMVMTEEGNFKFKNIHHGVVQPDNNDLLKTLFLAKKYGITTWDEKIEELLNNESINPVTKMILKSPSSKGYILKSETHDLNDLADIINYHNFCLFLIPGGSEIINLKHCYKFLNDIGISKEQMSVLFRLDNDTGKDFNEFVKMFQLNNPLDEKIKIVFLSGKIPKTLISYNKPIDVIINLGDESAHYTQKNLVKNHHCVINYRIRKQIANM